MYNVAYKLEFIDRLNRVCSANLLRKNYVGEVHSIVGVDVPISLSYGQRGVV